MPRQTPSKVDMRATASLFESTVERTLSEAKPTSERSVARRRVRQRLRSSGLGALLAAIVLLFGGPVLAGDANPPERTDAESARGDGPSASHMASAPNSQSLLRVAVPLALLLGVFGLTLVLHLRRKHREALTPPRPQGVSIKPKGGIEFRGSGLRDSQATLAAAASMAEIGLIEPATPPPPPHVLSESKRAECPSCGREFDSMLAMCPFDSEKLVPKVAASPAPALTDVLDTSVSYRSCPECGESFDVGANFCPYDRTPLEAEDCKREEGQHELLCPECGEIFDDSSLYCPTDGASLVRASEEHSHRMSVAPILICTRCGVEYPLGEKKCEGCNGELTFLHGRQTSGRLLRGGAISQVCPDCSERYGEELMFCAKDGQVLVSLN